MSSIKYMGHVDTAMMEPHVSGESVYYEQVDINNPSYACMDASCGLIWDRRHLAEGCEAKGHASTWWQGYGGGIVNGIYKPAKSYPRTAIGKLSKDKLLQEGETEVG